MKNIQEFINESLITESKKHPLINKEIKTNGEFEPGDIVLYRDIMEKSDEHAIMFVSANRGSYAVVEDIGTILTLGSSHNLDNDWLFKIGHVDCKLDKYNECKTITPEMIAEIFEICEKAGLDCTIPKEREMKRAKMGRRF
jgi:hypothetical protein